MKNYVTTLSALMIASLLAGCSGGSGGGNGLAGATPPTTKVNITKDVLEVAVGTASNANDATTGLNVVESFRQANGTSAVLANTPTLVGPSGFLVPSTLSGAYAASGNTDSGTDHISGSPQVNINTLGTNTTLGTFTGAFSYGFAPLNSDSQGAEGYFPGNPNDTGANGFDASTYANSSGATACAGNPCAYNPSSLPWWPQPLGDSVTPGAQGVYIIGPPAVPFFNNGTYPGGFVGYSPGFSFFEVPPAAGAYTLNVAVTISNAPSQAFSATSSALKTGTTVGTPSVSGVTENGGGLTGTVTPGLGATETLVFIQDANPGNSGATPPQAERNFFYTVGPITGTAAQAFTLPPMLGPCAGNGCQTNASTQTPSIVTGDTYIVTAISFDYPAFEAGPPGNVQETPTLTGTAGQDDLAIGLQATGTY